MAKRDVTITMTAKQAGVVQAWMDAQKSVKAFEQTVDSAGKTGAKAGNQANRSFGQMLMTMGSSIVKLQALSLALGAVRTIAGAAFRDLEKARMAGKDAVERQRSFADTLQAINLALPAGGDMNIQDIEKAIKQRNVGLSNAEKARIVQEGISAGEGPDVSNRLKVALDAAEVLRNFPEEVRQVLSAELIRSVRTFGGSAEENLAIAFAVQGAGPSGGNIKQFGTNILSGANQLASFGLNQEQAYSLLTAVQQKSGDVEGATSRTSTINMLRQLQALAGAAGVEEENMFKVMQSIGDADKNSPVALQMRKKLLGVADKTTRELLQQEAALGDVPGAGELKGSLSVRASAYVAIRELLQGGDTETKRLLEQVPQDIAIEKAEERLEKRMQEFEGTEAAQVKAVQFGIENLQGTSRGSAKAIREEMIKFMETIAGDVPQFGSAMVDEFKKKLLELETFGATDIGKLLTQFEKLAEERAIAASPRVMADRPIDPGGADLAFAVRTPVLGTREQALEFSRGKGPQAEIVAALFNLATELRLARENFVQNRIADPDAAPPAKRGVN